MVVDRYLLRPEEADIVVCMLWQHMGTPTIGIMDPDTGGLTIRALSTSSSPRIELAKIVADHFSCSTAVSDPHGTLKRSTPNIPTSAFLCAFQIRLG